MNPFHVLMIRRLAKKVHLIYFLTSQVVVHRLALLKYLYGILVGFRTQRHL